MDEKCPFCGYQVDLSNDIFWAVHHGLPGEEKFRIRCLCGAGTVSMESKEDAIRQWNTRPLENSLARQLKEARRKIYSNLRLLKETASHE